MGRHKKRHRSSSSSSSSSSDNDKHSKSKRHKKQLKRKASRIEALEGLIRELRKKSDYNSDVAPQRQPMVRYVGRNDFIPEFDPQTSSVSVEHWIRNLEGVASMHGWDERTLICNCTAKLGGYAKSWYERQDCYAISWEEWKSKLITAFPFTKNKLSQIRELVNRVKSKDEDPIKFYYDKLGIGMSCKMSDEVIAQAIVGTLGNKLLEVGALSAGCHDTNTLLKYLASMKTSSDSAEVKRSGVNKDQNSNSNKIVKCFTCGKAGHKARFCGKEKQKKIEDRKCKFCDRTGHVEETCFKKRNQSKHCSFCNIKGHSIDECRKKKAGQDKHIKKIQTEKCDASDMKYYKTVLVNDSLAEAFIDFGSSCNTMRQSFYGKLQLESRLSDNVIKGYGDGLILPLGVTTASLTVDGVAIETEFFIVPDAVQDFDILVGQPYTESPHILFVKTSTRLNVYDEEILLDIAEIYENLDKVRLYPNEDTMLKPGLNKVVVITEPFTSGVMKVKHSEQREPRYEKEVLSEEVESQDGMTMIKLINKTNESVQLNSADCVARAELLELETCECKIGEQLTESQRDSLTSLLIEFDGCFSGKGMELGNCDIEMTIKLTEDKVINYKPYRISYHERELVRQIIAELLEAGIIEESTSSYASPILLVKKKDGGFRLCVDYRALNKVTEKERYPLPLIQDLLDRLVNKSVFCRLDLANGYHQIKISPPSRPLTGFVTPDGHYQYRMMSFGLCNAPAVYSEGNE